MATAFIVLSYVHIVPLRLTIMVISRDIIILTGSFLYLLLFDASDIRATGLSKANTVVQILTVIYFLAVAAFPVETGALGAGKGTLPNRAVTLICAVTTVASGLQYLYIGLRKLSDA
jgi:cardiolipin synthase